MTPLLATAYLPPISYINECLDSGKIILEQHEHYIKQTWRNRANIYAANGLLSLIIPVQHKSASGGPIKDVKISYETDWQKIHWRSISSAYRNSPYYEFYEDDFAPFYQRKFESLFEFNLELLKKILALMKKDVEISFTSAYEKTSEGINDLRNHYNPSTHVEGASNYGEVDDERFGFVHDLSICD